jgi:16S rRNA A1518/A1519 N6-dimethyltransferase RsmA/KsgA/DIM1 with predicted DNA glycosylase/AP lyase activity
VFVLKIRNDDLEEAGKLYQMVSGLFLHKRKTIYNNLSQYLKDPAKAKETLEKAQIKANLRPQDISLDGYLKLLRSLY